MTYCGLLGEGSATLIAYMEAVPGVHPIKPGANPATWMLVHTLPGLLHVFHQPHCDPSRSLFKPGINPATWMMVRTLPGLLCVSTNFALCQPLPPHQARTSSATWMPLRFAQSPGA